MTATTWRRIGGFCEDYVGYGGEDTDFDEQPRRGADTPLIERDLASQALDLRRLQLIDRARLNRREQLQRRAGQARTTHLEALGAALWAGPQALREAAEAARAAPPAPEPPEAVDLLVDAFATRVTEGYDGTALRRALDAVLALEVDDDVGRWLWLTGSRGGAIVAMELWDADAWHTLVERHVRVARDMGALVLLQFGLQSLVRTCVLDGDLARATHAIEESRAIAEATGTPAVAYTELLLAAWRGQDALAEALFERETSRGDADGMGRIKHFATYSAAVLYNGIGRYEAALDAARSAFEHDYLGYTPFVVPELAEAASRTGEPALLEAALERIAEHTPDAPGDWALGIEARVRALAGEGEAAFRESIQRLARTRARLELARSRLLYGEWLRREGRRVDARAQLRTAREEFLATGADGFAERARHELLATGEKVRKRVDEARDELTPQEAHIARLAREGRTNPEIGAELFLSPRTVEWHLKKVFAKLGISSRRALTDTLLA